MRVLMALYSFRRFQSTPGFSAGRNSGEQMLRFGLAAFQSTPGFSAGRNICRMGDESAWRVSIHSRLFGREKLMRAATYIKKDVVSIHSRLFGREKLLEPFCACLRGPCFNPLPAFRPGETKRHTSQPTTSGRFNPLPAFRPGETWSCAG